MRTLALYSSLFAIATILLIFLTTLHLGGPTFVQDTYNHYRPHSPRPPKAAGPPLSHSQSHAWETKREWNYRYPRDARNYGLSEEQCLSAFPLLDKEVDRAVEWRHKVGKNISLEDLEVGWRGDGIVRAMIHDNQLYIIDPHGVWDHNHRPRALATLHSIHRAITAYGSRLPDIEFTVTDHDSALINLESNFTTWSYSRLAHQESLWLMPDFGFWAWPDVGMRSYSELQHILEEEEEEFLDKVPKIVWRGAVNVGSHDVRAGLLKAAENQPWSDVQSLDWSNKTNIKERLLSMEDHCGYMFVAQTEGNTYSGRLKYLLNCHSVLISHKLQWIEHFHHLLRPSGGAQNYVQVRRDFSDLPKKMNRFRIHDNIPDAERIADNSRETFKERYLTPAAEACYWRSLIRGWASVQGFEVEPFEKREVPDWTTGKTKIKRKFRGAPFESYTIMEAVEWDVPAKPRRVCIEE